MEVENRLDSQVHAHMSRNLRAVEHKRLSVAGHSSCRSPQKKRQYEASPWGGGNGIATMSVLTNHTACEPLTEQAGLHVVVRPHGMSGLGEGKSNKVLEGSSTASKRSDWFCKSPCEIQISWLTFGGL